MGISPVKLVSKFEMIILYSGKIEGSPIFTIDNFGSAPIAIQVGAQSILHHFTKSGTLLHIFDRETTAYNSISFQLCMYVLRRVRCI